MLARSYLFVPGNRPERYTKAFASAADVVVIDLEDAVADTAKPAAREAIAHWHGEAPAADRARLVVRINEAGVDAHGEDLRLLQAAGLTRVMLAKTESAAQIASLRRAVAGATVLPLIESARGLFRAAEIAAAEGIERLVFGTLDFALDLDLDIADRPDGLAHAASSLVLASRLAGLAAPVAGVTPQIEDEERLGADLAWERRHGLGAKLCVHPRQIEAVHTFLAPTAEELDWARRVIAAEAESPGAARLDGRMIDRPVVLRARRALQRAGDPLAFDPDRS